GLLSFGLFMGAVYCESPIICGLIYILSSLLTGVDGIICAGIRVAVIVVSLLIHKKLKKKVNRILLVLYILLANIFYICYKVTPKLLLDRFINVGVGLAFAFACIYILRALLVRGLKYRPSVEELVCGGALIVAFSKCLSAYNIFGIDIVRL
ncbi:MAG: hypothetical protein RRY18_02130, partial [Clostridia bacterium]